MLIDFHTHIFPEKIAESTINALASKSGSTPYTDGTANGMLDAMSRANADICVTLPVLTKATQFDSVTKFAISVNERFENSSRKLISFGGMHPDCDNVDDKLKYLKSVGIKGIKIHPDYQATYFDDQRYIDIINCAKKYDLIVVTHAGIDAGYIDQPVRCSIDRALNVIEQVNYDKLVLAHFGANRLWEEFERQIAGKNVYIDTAVTLPYINKQTFFNILEKHGSDKILFATDCPWGDIKEGYEILKSYQLDKEVFDKITHKNALKLLGI